MASRSGLKDVRPEAFPPRSWSSLPTPLGWWIPERLLTMHDPALLKMVAADLTAAIILVLSSQGLAIAQGGHHSAEPSPKGSEGYPVAGYLPPQDVACLGDRTFLAD